MATEVQVAIVVSLLALLGTVLQAFASRRDKSATKKDEADGASVVSDAAMDLLKPYREENQSLHEKLVKLDQRVSFLECELLAMKAEREGLLRENIDLRSQVASLQAKYEALKIRIAQTFDVLAEEISKLGEPLVDKHRVIEVVQWAKTQLPKTGPLG